MKHLFAVIIFSAVVTGYSQSMPLRDSMQAQINRQMYQHPSSQSVLTPQPTKPNEIKGDRLVYSGISVQLIKTDNPLQLINPAASAEYGSSADNTVWDPVTGRGTGLKVFSLQF